MQFKFFVINLLYKLFFFFNYKKICHFRILMLHDIKRKNFKKLESNLKFLVKNYNFINPNQLNKNQFPKKKKNLLLTFDDGFKSNFIFANKIIGKGIA